MAKREKKQNKRQFGKPEGTSKYALKVIKRNRAALALGLKPHTPWPIIWVNQD